MRDKIIAVAIIIIIIGAIGANTAILNTITTDLIKSIDSLDFDNDGAKSAAEYIWQKFKQNETYINLTVSHDDISNIEDCFCEMIGAINEGNTDIAGIAKYRLKNALEHLRRLSGINLDSII